MRRWSCMLAVVVLTGCVSEEPLRDEFALAVTVNGFPVDCLLETTVRTGPQADIAISAGEDRVRVLFGDDDVTSQLVGTDPRSITLDVPTDMPTTLRVTRADTFGCVVSLVQRASLQAAIDTLQTESATDIDYTSSDETGAPDNVTMRVGTTGDSPSSRAADFLSRHAGVFGAPADQLVEVDAFVAPDGWATVRFDQVIGGVRGHRANMDIEMDPTGIVTSVQARLFVDLPTPPSFTSTEAEVRAAVLDAGEIGDVTQVVFNPGRPVAAWFVDGTDRGVVLEDTTLEVLESYSTFDEATVEIHRPNPTPLPGSSRANMSGHVLIATAPSGPMTAPGGLNAADRDVWMWGADIANRVQRASGQNGWRASTHPSIPITRVGGDGVRFMTEPSSVNNSAGWYSYGIVYLGTASARSEAVVCHEYGHALHDTLRNQNREAGTIKEAVADVFWVFCDPWLMDRVRSGYRGQSFNSPPGREDQRSYDAFRAAGYTANSASDLSRVEGSSLDIHDWTYFLSTPFWRLVNEYDMPRERAEQLMYFTLGFRGGSGTERFRAFRDAIVQEADSWARNGRHGFTPDDACNVAQAFREMGLDGEYGRGADSMCEGSARSGSTSNDRYVCTGSYCPMCPAVENVNPCDREPDTSEPHCVAPGAFGAGDRRICVGALALTSDGCSPGEIHHCWCQEDGSWECPNPCQDPGEGIIYCPERGGAAAGFTGTNCSASVGSGSSLPAGVPLVLVGLVLAVRRRRS
ncbi:MAG: hypothetical protein AB8I08_27020 [Sandaracinaceae bacterium]